jgi:transcription elongation factor Elf1
MKIKQITKQNRRDFEAIYICEHCNNEEKIGEGYDDAFFHKNIIPKMECKKCGKSADKNYIPNMTKYPEGYQV